MQATFFHFHADLDDPSELVAAVSEATGERDVRLLRGWDGCDRETGRAIEDEETGAVNVERLRREGRFSLDVQVYGANIAPGRTSAGFARAVAKSLQRSVLFSDCGGSSFSYFSAEPDGSIWAQTLVVGDDSVMDLDTFRHEDPRRRCPRMVFGPDEPLPERPAGKPESWHSGDPTCDTAGAGTLCRVFYAPCPRRRLAVLAPERPGSDIPD